MKKIALVGAFDRNNYGDVMMPIIVEKALEDEKYLFDYYALQNCNLENIGGKKCRRIKDIEKDNCDAVILVGGEILSANYSGMFKNLQNNSIKLFIYRCLNKIWPLYFEKFAKIKLNGKTNNPWIYGKDDFKCEKILYNTVGGRNIIFDNNYLNCLNEADYISVRDEMTQTELKENGIDSKLYPDSVVILSKIFNKDSMYEYVKDDITDEIKKIGKYFVFQVNKSTGKNKEKKIASQIDKIIEKTGMGCVLLPIGYAQGHEDYKPLNKIFKKIENKGKIYMPKSKDIYTILCMLGNSELYVGTSLHGAITAISYGIPHIAFSDKISKLLDFLKTWKTTSIINTDENNLCDDAIRIINDKENKEKLMKASSEIISKVSENFQSMKRIIDGEENEERK